MTPEERKATLDSWQKLLDRLKADSSLPLPAYGTELWPLWFRAAPVQNAKALEALADKLGVASHGAARLTSDNGWLLAEVDGWADGLRVHVVADVVTPVLPPVAGEGAIVRSYAVNGAL
jgi:hypothetical protein